MIDISKMSHYPQKCTLTLLYNIVYKNKDKVYSFRLHSLDFEYKTRDKRSEGENGNEICLRTYT